MLTSKPRRAALPAFLLSRLLVLVVAAFAVEALPINSGEALAYGIPRLAHPFGGAVGDVSGALVRWDSVWYLLIAHHGYSGPGGLPSTMPSAEPWSGSGGFFPLYPLIVHALSGFAASPAALVVAGTLVSLAAFAGALVLLESLTTLDLDARAARAAVWLCALFPGALYFSAPYAESLFLCTSIACFWFGRKGSWALAGLAGGLAAAARPQGVLLVVPLALFYLYGPRGEDRAPDRKGIRPRFTLRTDALWLILIPCGLAAYGAYLAATTGDFFAYSHAYGNWGWETVSPLTFVWHAFHGAVTSSSDLANNAPGALAARQDWLNILLLPFFVFEIVATVGVCRRLPLPYGAYALLYLLGTVSRESTIYSGPLVGIVRHLAVCFPLFMWFGAALERRRIALPAVCAGFALLLAVATAQFAQWEWIAP